MAGMGARFGDAALLDCEDETALGETINEMLTHCRNADIDRAAQLRKEALQRKWHSNEEVSDEELLPGFEGEPNWEPVFNQFPALAKGPGTYLRTFAAAMFTERDAWKSRKLTQLKKSEYRGAISNGESIRIRCAIAPSELGGKIIECLRAW